MGLNPEASYNVSCIQRHIFHSYAHMQSMVNMDAFRKCFKDTSVYSIQMQELGIKLLTF